ncbi:PfkB family carbohydrate kinase [soil metagenome]
MIAGAPARQGGSVFYAASALSRMGTRARIAASCAVLDRPQLVEPLEAFGLPVAWHESSVTAAYSFHYEGDRRIMRQDAVGDPWNAEQAVEAVGDARWVHVGALVRTDFPEGTLAALAAGRRLLVDAQGLVRTPEAGPLRLDGRIGGALRHVAMLKLNEEEAETLAGSAEPEGLRSLRVPEVILTLGSQGSFVITAREIEHVPTPPMQRSVDPTGAGDVFSSAYLAARAAYAEPVEAARSATEIVAAFLDEG